MSSRFRQLWVPGRWVLGSAIVLFLLLNVVAALFIPGKPTFLARHGMMKLKKAYPGRSEGEIRQLLDETEKLGSYEYEPFTEYRTRPFTGRFVSIGKEGFRPVKGQAPWPPDPAAANVFVFGGSTTVGDGLADEETIPSRLQEALRLSKPGVRVFNVARPGYFSAHERILLEQLLLVGITPTVAVFVDGLNDFASGARPLPPYLWAGSKSDVLRQLVLLNSDGSALRKARRFAGSLPLVRFLQAVFAGPEAIRDGGPPAEALARWVRGKEMIEAIARARGFQVLFVWQPVPFYRYDLRYHLFGDDVPRWLSPELYERMRSEMEAGRLGGDFLWLADAAEGRKENLYVDGFHYSAAFSTELASRISAAIVERNLLPVVPGP